MKVHQLNQRRIKNALLDVAGPELAGLAGTKVESHVGISDGVFDFSLCFSKISDAIGRLKWMMLVHGILEFRASPSSCANTTQSNAR